MSCPRCKSDDLYQFEAAPRVKASPPAKELPQVCRSCGAILLGGVFLPMPEGVGEAAIGLADKAEEAAAASKAELEQDPDRRIDEYLQKLYKTAYLDGFLRALAYFQHEAKEGRLKRIRDLWNELEVEHQAEFEHLRRETILIAPTEAYNEISRLLSFAPGGSNGSRASNQHPSVQKSTT